MQVTHTHTHTHVQRRREDKPTDATDVLGLEGLNDSLAVHQCSTRSVEEHHTLHGRDCVNGCVREGEPMRLTIKSNGFFS